MSLEVDDGIKTREELDSIFEKYLPWCEIEMDAIDDIEVTVREPEITKYLSVPFKLLKELEEWGYTVKSLSTEIENIDDETFAVLKIVIGWKN